MPSLSIPYFPHPKQLEIHADPTRFKIVAAGRRFGKTVLGINEILRHAINSPADPSRPVPRSWYICDTYKHAEMVAWKTFLKYCPDGLIKSKNNNKLLIELINGHLVEFKGSEDPDKLRGVSLVYVVLDEYGQMRPEVWDSIIRPALMDVCGGALFIGTPAANGSPHFHDLFMRGKSGQFPDYKSWLCYSMDNTSLPDLPSEIEKARRESPPDVFKREYMADFSTAEGLIYDNFKHTTHVIPTYVPDQSDFVVGAIDPGLLNPTAALLCAWDRNGVGRIFWEYYQTDKLSSENATAIKAAAAPYKVAYWVIDRASAKRDPSSGISVFDKYSELLRPIVTAAGDPHSVWAGIDEVKKLFHVSPDTGRPRLHVAAQCHKFLWEIAMYTRYRPRYNMDSNPKEAPRKLHDHLMDALRYMVATRPWLRTNVGHLYGKPMPTGY